MTINKTDLSLNLTKALEKIKTPNKSFDTKESQPLQKTSKNFADLLSDAIKEVDGLQKEADKKIAGLVTGKGNVTPHEAMIALEKADLAFQLMDRIRSKIVRAYQEIMRTQV
ncbi:MAG: flagellar hook-basal body complex protein FliE [Candidatus Dadabacteria bacterium]|nr:MAG: flagellar hook-basal body complex protein FliE [Candidatus Dadabacteria bacterium]